LAIAAYAADIIFTSNVAAALQGWYADHLSWRWIFGHAALVTPLMMALRVFRRSPPPTRSCLLQAGADLLISA